MKKVLITAAGGGGTNNMIATLNDDHYVFFGTNIDRFKAACSQTERTYLVPRAVEEEAYISAINQVIEKENIDLVVPNSDIEVEVLAKNREKIKSRLFLPSYEAIRICQDKMLMHDFCLENNIHVARAIPVHNMDDLEGLEEKLGPFPLWCRIRSGSGSKHTSKVYSVEDARHFIQHAITAYHVELSEFIISELLPGEDYLVMTTWQDGKLILSKMAHRMHYFKKQGESPPYVIKTYFDQELLDFAIETAHKFQKHPHGNYNFDLKRDTEGRLALTEINPGRFYYNMPMFNLSKPYNAFQIFLKSAFNELDPTMDYPLLKNEEKYFIRDMDNWPSVLTPNEIEERISKL
jgi:carbamoylphosphate synthase large subunit